MSEELRFEIQRQILHAAAGVILAFLLLEIGKINFIAVSIILLASIGLAIYYIQDHLRSSLAGIIGKFERQGSPVFNDAFLFIAGALISAFLFEEMIAFWAILILGIADAVAPVVGVAIGKHKLPWNKNKSFEGSIGFFIPALALLYYVEALPIAIGIAIIMTFVESVPKINDNITIPIAAGILMLLL